MNTLRIIMTGSLFAAVMLAAYVAVIRGTGPKHLRQFGRPEVWALAGSLLVAGIVAALVSQRDAGYWRPLMQFALGDWPDVDALPQPVLFWGVVLNVLTAFGFPILLITFLYRRLTRSTTMQIGHYITRRDEFLKVQMYLILRERVPDLDADAWDIVEQAMEETQQTWDSVLPPETLNSLERDEVVVIEDQPRFARINR